MVRYSSKARFFFMLLVIIGIIAAFMIKPLSFLSVVGPEGLDIKVVAIGYGGNLIKRGDSWVLDDYVRISMWDDKAVKLVRDGSGDSPKNCKGQPGICEYGPGWWYDNDGGELLIEVSRPQLMADFTPPNGWKSVDSSHSDVSGVKKIVWSTYLPNGTLVKRVGELVPAEFVIQVASQGREGDFGLYTWKNIDVWFELYGVSWTPYDPNPPGSNASGKWVLVSQSRAYVVPIITWVKAATPWLWRDDKGNLVGDYLPHSEMESWLSFYPDMAGREFTMYYDINEYYSGSLSLEDVINDNPLKYVAPDPRMVDHVFIHLRIDRYGPYAYTECGGWTVVPCCISPKLEVYYPASYIKVRTLLLVWGEFHYVWTSKEAHNQGYVWGNRTSSDVEYHMDSPFIGLARFLSTPQGIMFMLLLLAAILLILAVVAGFRPSIVLKA